MLEKLQNFIYRFKYNYGRVLPLTIPVDVSLELASACNMACKYCYHSDKEGLPFTRALMPLDMAKTILRQSAEIGVNAIKLNWRGESTLNPHFSEIARYANDLAHGSTFIDRLTNSNFKFSTIDENIFKGLLFQTKVKVSYDSFDKEVFETQRAGGNHNITTANIDKFYNYPGRKTELVIQAVRTKLNKDEDLEGQCKKRWPQATLSIREVVEGRVNKDLGSLVNNHRDVSERRPCLQANVRLLFSSSGTVHPCCPDIRNEISYGSIQTHTVKQLFNSEIAKQLRKDLKSGKAFDKNPCLTCSSYESYKNFKSNWNS